MIALGSDHGGYDLKVQVMEHLKEKGICYGEHQRNVSPDGDQ